VFLVGAARSGTSLTYKLLCLHPDVAYISNWVARFPALPHLAALNRVGRAAPNRQRRVWFDEGSNAYVYGRTRPLRDRLFPMPVEGEPVYARCGITPSGEDAGEPSLSRLRQAFGTIRRASGGGRILNKRIANNRRIPLLLRAFPSARFIDVLRDGRAVAYSLSRVDWWEDSEVWWYGGTPRRWREEGRDPWEICARNWVEELDAIEAGLGQVPRDQVLGIRYEELVEDPIPTLGRMAGFAGLAPSARWRSAVAALEFPNRNETWRERLPAEVVQRITTIQRDRLAEHGYLDG
jgi:hypothetical protein